MAQQWRILVVEGDETLNRSIVATLTQDGYSVHGVATGVEAIRILWTSEQHLVIGDRSLPDVDGFDMLQWIRAYRPNTRMMMLGTPGSPGRRTRALEQGAVAYFEKPIDLLLLKVEVRRLLQQTGFTANLDSFDLLDVIQIINMSRKSIALVVHTGLEEQGMLGFREGELIWAEYGTLRGEEAFFALAAYKNGMVTQQAWNDTARPNVAQPLSRLIVQALHYRSKYEAAQQVSSEHKALSVQFPVHDEAEPDSPLDALLTENPDDRPFVYMTAEAEYAAQHASNPGPEFNTREVAQEQQEKQLQAEAKPWWYDSVGHPPATRPAQLENVDVTSGSRKPAQHAPRSGVQKMIGGASVESETVGVNSVNGATITPSTVRKTPAGQRSDLPTWLIDQPTQFELEALPLQQSMESLRSDARNGISPLPQTPTTPPVPMSSMALRTDDLQGEQPGELVVQQKSKRNYPALVSALETVGYSLPGFIALAVVSMDGQPIAQVATDELDITEMCGALSGLLQRALLTLDKGAWGQHEDTIITSATHHILLRVPTYATDIFEVLVTTRESDPVESLDALATVEGAIISAL